MGLDITAWSNLEFVGFHEPFEDDEDGDRHYEEHVEAFSYDAFAAHALPLDLPKREIGTTPWSGDGMSSVGCYKRTPASEGFSFRAGSCGGYGAWRRMMAELFNPYRIVNDENVGPSPEGPFYELLWFADNEGTLCTPAAKNLLACFRSEQHRATYALAADGRMELWDDWLHACVLAAQGGLINFH